MKIDMHVHSSDLSACSHMTVWELLEAAKTVGLGAVVLTEHHRFRPWQEIRRLNREFAPLKVFQGIEITVPRIGSYEGDDLLLYGVHNPALEENRDWTYEELYRMTREWNGWITLAHPFRYQNRVTVDVGGLAPDAVEIHSTNIGADDTPAILKLTAELYCKAFQSSDAHNAADVGIYHMELAEDAVETEDDLLRALRARTPVLCSRPGRILEYNTAILEREDRIRGMIQAGKAGEDYVRETGKWIGHFNRVAMGKSYRI